MTQKDCNPFLNSDSNKRYYTYDYFTKKTFGGKCAKIPLDAGFSCPNKDGKCGTGGCIYCLSGSASSIGESIYEQYQNALNTASKKWDFIGIIPYLQAGSNTYGTKEKLREIYNEASSLPGAVMLDIATRADCLDDYMIDEILKVSEKIPVTVELGLQTSNDSTARLINRGYSYEKFVEGYQKIRAASKEILLGIHLINGLPYENENIMIKSAEDVASLRPNLVKFHVLNVLKGTELEKMYSKGEYEPMSRKRYVDILVSQLELLSEEVVIGRAVSDAPADVLRSPDWSLKKTITLNLLDKELFKRNTYQGRLFRKEGNI